MKIDNLKKELMVNISLITMGFLSYAMSYFSYRRMIKGNYFIDIVSLVLIYIYGKKRGSFCFLIGISIGFIFIDNFFFLLTKYFSFFLSLKNTIPVDSFLKFSVLNDGIFMFFHSLFFFSIVDKWNQKKIFKYFIRNSFLFSTYYIFTFIIINLNTPISNNQSLSPENSLTNLIRMSTLGLGSMFANIKLFIISMWVFNILPYFTMRFPSDYSSNKINIINYQFNRIIFILLIIGTGITYYYKYFFLTLIFITYTCSFMFIFFLIGRNLFFRVISIFTNNVIANMFIFSLLNEFLPSLFLFYFLIATGFIQAYLNIWNENQDME